jgi:hypothetical protein
MFHALTPSCPTNSGGAPIHRCRRDQVPAAFLFDLLASQSAAEYYEQDWPETKPNLE